MFTYSLRERCPNVYLRLESGKTIPGGVPHPDRVEPEVDPDGDKNV
jgi:hypothetical protein